jgi:hypothetical protein
VEVTVFGSIGNHPHTLTTKVCGDYCKYQVSSEKGRQNMGFLTKIKFWRKKNNTNTPTMVDACVSTEDPQTCDTATVSTDPTVMCVVYTQTEETRMDVGGAAAKQVYERQPEMNTQKI